MKGTEQFKQTIKAYLDKRAAEDELFAASYAKEGKSISKCVTYILNQVQESGCCGFADDEVYSMAVHYYDEDNIEIDKPINGQVVVNHHIELTDEEKAEAHRNAVKAYQQEELYKLRERNSKPKHVHKEENKNQLSLF